MCKLFEQDRVQRWNTQVAILSGFKEKAGIEPDPADRSIESNFDPRRLDPWVNLRQRPWANFISYSIMDRSRRIAPQVLGHKQADRREPDQPRRQRSQSVLELDQPIAMPIHDRTKNRRMVSQGQTEPGSPEELESESDTSGHGAGYPSCHLSDPRAWLVQLVDRMGPETKPPGRPPHLAQRVFMCPATDSITFGIAAAETSTSTSTGTASIPTSVYEESFASMSQNRPTGPIAGSLCYRLPGLLAFFKRTTTQRPVYHAAVRDRADQNRNAPRCAFFSTTRARDPAAIYPRFPASHGTRAGSGRLATGASSVDPGKQSGGEKGTGENTGRLVSRTLRFTTGGTSRVQVTALLWSFAPAGTIGATLRDSPKRTSSK
jgi:hypothetical protein